MGRAVAILARRDHEGFWLSMVVGDHDPILAGSHG